MAIFTPRIYSDHLKYALAKININVKDYSYDFYDKSNQIKYFLSKFNNNFAIKEQEKKFNYLIELFLKENEFYKYDILFFFKGQKINNNNVERLLKLKKERIKIIYWGIDTKNRTKYVNCNIISDYNYYIDQNDCINLNDYWLPLGIDIKNFFPTFEKKYDITFIGRMKSKLYSKRYEFFKKLISSPLVNKFNINVISNLKICDNKKINYYYSLPYLDFCEIIRKSKIVINIHQDDGVKPINPMFFSIPYCASLQVVDSREYFENWLTPNVFYFECNLINFIELIENLLYNYNTYAERLRNMIHLLDQHTMSSRFLQILNNI